MQYTLNKLSHFCIQDSISYYKTKQCFLTRANSYLRRSFNTWFRNTSKQNVEDYNENWYGPVNLDAHK